MIAPLANPHLSRREGGVGGLRSLRRHEAAAGEGGVAVELAVPVHFRLVVR